MCPSGLPIPDQVHTGTCDGDMGRRGVIRLEVHPGIYVFLYAVWEVCETAVVHWLKWLLEKLPEFNR